MHICSIPVVSSSQVHSHAVLLYWAQRNCWEKDISSNLLNINKIWPSLLPKTWGKDYEAGELDGPLLVAVYSLYPHLSQKHLPCPELWKCQRPCKVKAKVLAWNWGDSIICSLEQGQSKRARKCLVVTGKSTKELKPISVQWEDQFYSWLKITTLVKKICSSSYDLCVRDRDEIQFSWVTSTYLRHQTILFLPTLPRLIHLTSSNLCNKWVRGFNRQQMPSQHKSDSPPWQSGKNHM